jgi:hypothetical protein
MASFTDAPVAAPVIKPLVAATAAQLMSTPDTHPVKMAYHRFLTKTGATSSKRKAREFLAASGNLKFDLYDDLAYGRI